MESNMYKQFDRDQDTFLPNNIADLIPRDDLVFSVVKMVETINIDVIYQKYSNLGQNAYDPKMLLSVLIYAYTQGIFSSRKIEERIKFDIRYRYLTGMSTPCYSIISEFRRNNLKYFNSFFKIVVKMCAKAGLLKLDEIAIDGTKIQASASNKKKTDISKVEIDLQAVEDLISGLLEQADKAVQDESPEVKSNLDRELKDTKKRRQKLLDLKEQLESDPDLEKINATDPDSRTQKAIGPGYNAQIAVDCNSYVIAGNKVVQDANDVHQLLPMIEETEISTGSEGKDKNVYADCGYASASAFEELENKEHLDAYVPTREQVNRNKEPIDYFDKYSFNIDLDAGKVICPQGYRMHVKDRGEYKNGQPYLKFQGTDCPNCPLREQCTKGKYRTLCVMLNDSKNRDMEVKMDSDKGLKAMKIRKQTVEPVIGVLKEHLGFRRFSLRGLRNVNGEFNLLCAAYNTKKLFKFLKGRPLKEVISFIFDFWFQDLVRRS